MSMFDSRSLMVFKSILLSSFIAVLFFGCKGRQAVANFSSDGPVSQPVNLGSSSGVAAQTSYADVVNRVSPSVVTVRSTERVRPSRQFPFLDDPFFRDFFGDQEVSYSLL